MSELDKISELAKAKGLEFSAKVNALAGSNVIGVEELSDVANSFFDVCEVIEMKLEGKPVTIGTIISEVAPGILPSVLGGELIGAEASDLQDEEITTLVNLGDQHPLGDNAPKYKQALKVILYAVQSIFIFKK